MQIELSNAQFRALIKLVYLGEWMVNGASPQDVPDDTLQAAADALYAYGPKFDAQDWVKYCDECGAYHPNEAMEDATLPLIDKYDEETFWDVLSHHLAYRDLMVTADGEKELSKGMEMRLWRRKEQYEQEFRQHGLDHVRLVFHGGKK